MWSVPRCYKQDSLKQRVNFWLEFWVVQVSEVTWSSWLVSERVQLSVESHLMKRRLGGWCEMAASLGPSFSWGSSVDKSSARVAVTEDLSAGSWRISRGKRRCQETSNGDSNRLRTLVSVCQRSGKCSSEWGMQVINKSNSPILTPSIVTKL
jgi:hypothetical protein